MLPVLDNVILLSNLTGQLVETTLLSMRGNINISDNTLIRDGLRTLEGRLPLGWAVGALTESLVGTGVDATAEIRAPDSRIASLGIEAKSRITPKIAADVIARVRAAGVVGPLVISNFISAATGAFLRQNDVGYVDLTGNIRLVLSNPGLFIETVGATENPEKEERTGSLKGTKAGRVVRTLIEQRDPLGVRDLAEKAGVDAGYVSRLFAFFDTEALITRVGRGRIESVAWPKMLERWAADAPLSSRGRITTYIEPRGTAALLEKLRATSRRYAITGSFAAAHVAPVAPPRLLTLYVEDVAALVDETNLRPTKSGANVQIVEPVDEEVFRGVTDKDGLRYAALPQVVVDLLDGPGRAPAEAEELIAWMKKNEEAWRG